MTTDTTTTQLRAPGTCPVGHRRLLSIWSRDRRESWGICAAVEPVQERGQSLERCTLRPPTDAEWADIQAQQSAARASATEWTGDRS